jgi:UDP-N-acetyl-2-amino-2-deoxyglucuronate dehydrogenase
MESSASAPDTRGVPGTIGYGPVMGEQLRVGFLGAGLIATYHSKSLRHSNASIVRAGVYDPDVERAAAFAAASGHTSMASEDDVLDSCDAIYVCTWTSEHLRQVEKAASRRLAIFCEKPLAFDVATAEQMAMLVDQAGVVNQVGLVLRHSPAYLWARHLIDDPNAGVVMGVVFRDDQFIPIQGRYDSTWRSNRTLAGAGTLLEHSIHDVDMLRFLVGEIDRVSTHTTNFHGHDGIEDVATATVRFGNGALGTLASIWHDNMARPSLRRVEIFCARRHIVIEGDDWYGPVSWTDTDGESHTLTGDELSTAVAPLRHGSENPDTEFVAAVLAGTPATPNFADAVEAHRILSAMYESANADGASIEVGRG